MSSEGRRSGASSFCETMFKLIESPNSPLQEPDLIFRHRNAMAAESHCLPLPPPGGREAVKLDLEAIGAELVVRSVPGEGTTVVLLSGANDGSRTLGTQQRAGNGSFAP